ncbi:hypothetical protein [Streptomyces sp. B3I8]|uniref:hypothetical protein n=1 Tax=Streptomyces sp. B3I8 TaxID=3042303 RepID=UPI00277D6C4A|nr:hypothetical protein [Streptomyces sp. B3I8]MDQ0787765.1 hypothetical protein [Streptomyces sp. B3I8]
MSAWVHRLLTPANCVLAHDAVRLLAARGRRAQRLADGMLEWRLAELPVETCAA